MRGQTCSPQWIYRFTRLFAEARSGYLYSSASLSRNVVFSYDGFGSIIWRTKMHHDIDCVCMLLYGIYMYLRVWYWNDMFCISHWTYSTFLRRLNLNPTGFPKGRGFQWLLLIDSPCLNDGEMQRGQGAAAGPIDGDGTLFNVGCASIGVDRNRFPRTLNRTSVENSDGPVRFRKIRARKKKCCLQ